MRVNFYPSREQVSKEIDQCIAVRNTDTLMSFCKSCISNALTIRFNSECQNCKVKDGLNQISRMAETQQVHEAGLITIA